MRTMVFVITMLGVGVFGKVFRESKGPGALSATVLMGFGKEMFLEVD
jgi:hypothetical protein